MKQKKAIQTGNSKKSERMKMFLAHTKNCKVCYKNREISEHAYQQGFDDLAASILEKTKNMKKDYPYFETEIKGIKITVSEA